MKCQYFFAEFASLSMFPINSEYVLHAVSKPKDVSMSSFFKSPSIVFGHPITCIPDLLSRKYSASTAAFVLESSPPIITIASSLCSFATFSTILNCSLLSSFVRPEPIISKPPVFLYMLIISSVNLMYLFSISPLGPPRNPISSLSLCSAFNAS